jgi:hypothetical protein
MQHAKDSSSTSALGRIRGSLSRLATAAGAIALLLTGVAGAAPGLHAQDAAGVAGRVYHDANRNGRLDAGDTALAGVTVTLAAPGELGGGAPAAAVSDGRGFFQFEAGAGYWLLAGTPPVGYALGPVGDDGGGALRLVQRGDWVDLPLVATESATGAGQPVVIVPVMAPGDRTLAAGTASVVSILADRQQVVPLASVAETGALWGSALDDDWRTLYLAAVARRFADLGPGGLGAIYRIGLGESGRPVSLLTTLAEAGVAPVRDLSGRSGDTALADGVMAGAVGKVGLGGLALDAERQTLWVMNLTARTLEELQLDDSGAVVTARRRHLLPSIGYTPACRPEDLRPWAVTVHAGQVYAGVVCSAEQSGVRTELYAYVLRHDPAGAQGNFTWVAGLGLDYAKGCTWLDRGCGWNPWHDLPPAIAQTGGLYPQPILATIGFAGDGALLLAFMDRFGLQSGARQLTPDGELMATGVAAGDLLRLCAVNGAWVAPGQPGCANQRANGQGPGGGEYFFEDNFSALSDEVLQGALAYLPRSDEWVATTSAAGDLRAGGLVWLEGASARTSGYLALRTEEDITMPGFGQTVATGALAVLTQPPPAEIDLRLWQDRDGNHRQDGGEEGMPGLPVALYRDGRQIGEAQADERGWVRLGGAGQAGLWPGERLAAGVSYELRIAVAALPAGAQLAAADHGDDRLDSDGWSDGSMVVAAVTIADVVQPVIDLAVGWSIPVAAAEEPAPVQAPTTEPVIAPTVESTAAPTSEPVVVPTVESTAAPTSEPMVVPTVESTVAPTIEPTVVPTVERTVAPTVEPSVENTATPVATAAQEATATPTATATLLPTPAPAATATQALTATLQATATPVELTPPAFTALPDETATLTATATASETAMPAMKPMPTETATVEATAIPEAAAPTAVPIADLTLRMTGAAPQEAKALSMTGMDRRGRLRMP